MSLDEITTCPFQWTNRLEGAPIEMFLRAAVDRDVVLGWHRPGQNASSIVIMIGEEQLSLEFFDEESLRRLRDVADRAIPQLRAVIEEGKRRNEEFLRIWHAERTAQAGAI